MIGAGAYSGNPGLIAGGGSLIAGDIASDASKKAQGTLEDASDQAMAVNQQAYDDTRAIQQNVYNTTRNDLTPYMAVGSASMGTLGSMVGQKPQAAPAQATAGSLGSMATPPASSPLPAAGDGGMAAPAQTRAAMATQSAYTPGEKRGGSLGRTGGLVRMQAPDGTLKFVPQAKAALYEAQGAVEV